MNPAARAALATTLFALVHSALASDQAKARARSLGKKEWVDGTYRIFFVGQALLTFGLLAAYIAKQDRQTIYRVKAPASLLLRAVQGAALIFGYRAAREAGLAKLSGWERVQALRNKGALPKGPAAQGPEEKGGVLTARGPYRWSRHPLNFMPIPFLWANPHLTSRLLGFNLVSTIYLALGSLHEEKRLRAQYGKAYEEYQKSGVPFFIPRRPSAATLARIDEIAGEKKGEAEGFPFRESGSAAA